MVKEVLHLKIVRTEGLQIHSVEMATASQGIHGRMAGAKRQGCDNKTGIVGAVATKMKVEVQ
jgi:hypothetical protein